MPRGRKRTISGASRETAAAKNATSVSAARLAVQSTIDLVAQLSENLPQYMSIDSTLRQHNEKMKRDAVSSRLRGGASASSSYAQSPERKKRKYERKVKEEVPVEKEALPIDDRRESLLLRLPRATKEEEGTLEAAALPLKDFEVLSNDESSQEAPTKKTVNWLAILPSRDELQRRAAAKEAKKAARMDEHERVYMLRVGLDDLVALPYLQDPTVPDFIKYKYPNPKQYYVEDDKPYAGVQ